MKIKELLLFGILLFPAMGKSQTERFILPDSETVDALYNYIDLHFRSTSDSVLECKDSINYKVVFMVSGGYTSWRDQFNSQFVSIVETEKDSMQNVRVTLKKGDSAESQFVLQKKDTLEWYYTRGIRDNSYSKIIMTSGSTFSLGEVVKDIELILPKLPFQDKSTFLPPSVRSYDQGKYLMINWPLVLQQGGETSSGFQYTWFLERE